jgi:hypothetical protein
MARVKDGASGAKASEAPPGIRVQIRIIRYKCHVSSDASTEMASLRRTMPSFNLRDAESSPHLAAITRAPRIPRQICIFSHDVQPLSSAIPARPLRMLMLISASQHNMSVPASPKTTGTPSRCRENTWISTSRHREPDYDCHRFQKSLSRIESKNRLHD